MNPLQNHKNEQSWIPDGFHFLGPAEAETRRNLISSSSRFLLEKGYSEVIPPSFDFSSSFATHLPPGIQDSLLRIKDHGGREMSPSTDLTIQVVKGMAAFSHSHENQNVFYFGRRVRDAKKQNASRREVHQLGIEILGDSHLSRFVQLLQEIHDCIDLYPIQDSIVIVFGYPRILESLLSKMEIPIETKQEILHFTYTKNAFNLKEAFSSSHPWLDFFLESLFPKTIHQASEILKQWKDRIPDLAYFALQLEELDKLTKGISKPVLFDFSLLSEMSYYSGLVVHGSLYQQDEPIFAGGFYDELYEKFSGKQKSAFGIALNLELWQERISKKEQGR